MMQTLVRPGPQTSNQPATNKPNNNLMKKTATILAVLSMSAASVLAGPLPPAAPGPPPPPMSDPCAGPIIYNSLELLYANTDSDNGGDDADGVRLTFEYSPASNFFVRLGASYDEADFYDVFGITAGVGGYIALTENIHAVADGGLIYQDWDFANNFADGDDTGWYVRPHLRAKWGCFEVHAGATYEDINDDEEWNWFAKVYYQVAQGWDLTAGYNEGGDDDFEVWTVGARWRY
jgi:hypothetical protein